LKKKINQVFEKVPIIGYILTSLVKTFIAAVVIFGVVFAVLKLTGIYDKIDSALNLKADSPFIQVPLFTFLALAVLCFFIGFLFYFYKYRRPKNGNSKFNNEMSKLLENNTK